MHLPVGQDERQVFESLLTFPPWVLQSAGRMQSVPAKLLTFPSTEQS